jgi:hypothetical protein
MPMDVRDCPQIIPEIGPQHTLETMSEQRLAVDGGNTRASAWRPGGRTGLERGLDGGGDQQRGLGVDGYVPAEQYAADDPPGVGGASCGSAAMSALLVEVVVHGGAVHADGLGDLGDGVLPLAVRAGGLVHAAHRGGLPGVQLGLAAPGAAAGAGGVQALAGALDDQLALELVDRAEDMEGVRPR